MTFHEKTFFFLQFSTMNYATEKDFSCNINLIENEIAAVKTEINNENKY